MPTEPTLTDVIARLDRIEQGQATLALEVRATSAELRATRAELSLQITELRESIRDLWTEHLGHYHPDEPA